MREAEIGVLQKEKMHFSPRQSTFSHAECQGNKGLAGLKGPRAAGHPFSRTGFYTDIWHLALCFMVEKPDPDDTSGRSTAHGKK